VKASRWTLALAGALLAGCVGGGSPTPDTLSTPAATTAVASSSPISPTPTDERPRPTLEHLRPITLIADLSERPAPWVPVMFVPFGPQADAAGALLSKRLASQPIVPPSFAIDRDGSLWLLDLVKHRIEHYAPSGALIDVVGGLQFNRFRPYAQDLGFVGSRLFVTEFTHNTLQTFVREVTPSGIGRRVRIESSGRPLLVGHLVSPEPEMFGYASGSSGISGQPPEAGGIHGYQSIDPDSGQSRTRRGLLMADGSLLGISPRLINEGGGALVVHQVLRHVTHRFLRLDVEPHASSDVHIRIVGGWQTYVALPHGFATYVGFSPSRVVDQDRYQGSTRWLLEYFDDGEPLVWEPLPESPLEGAHVWRYLAEGLDGHLYLMLAEKGGMRIYRRPGPPQT
jgi:hypothetical protein